ncbi:efflux RND transporter periplasmic adaptor subunit [Ideonella sp. YS5]|uniref:efflux RND transporter periplasmic adaptor subunit n=1 Tax=Ideonella sp. YS5 TaxID=3453714 RepID=UPI003EEAEC79
MSRRRASWPAPSLMVAALSAVVLAGSLAGCSKTNGAQAASKPGAAASAPTLLLAAEDIRTVSSGLHAMGPVVTGSIQPERRADLRAEISAVVLQALKDNGEPVRKGELLVRLDDTAIRDSLASAEEAARAAGQSADQAERTFQRLKTLQGQGMSSMQATDDAEVRRNNAQSDLVAARSRVVSARQQLQRTEVRAPFDGVISDRKVSAGDTAQVGKELLKVIDPSSMRFEGLVSSDRMSELQVGQPVSFRINGFGQQEFRGKVRRVDVSANASTRQVEVLIAFEPGSEPPKVAGLYAEGLVATGGQKAVMLPDSTLTREGDNAFAWRVQGSTLKKVPVKLGDRDQRSGDTVILAGLAEGDQLLRKPSATLVDGQHVERAAAPAPASAASATKGS